MEESEKKELAVSKIVLIILALVGLLFIVWIAWIRPSEDGQEINSFQACVEAGNPVQESYPEVCVTPDSRRFTNPQQN